MNTQINKPNKIAYLPTKLNYITTINRRIKTHRQYINASRILILALLIWNMFLSISLILPNNIPHFTDKQNEQIMMLEEIEDFN